MSTGTAVHRRSRLRRFQLALTALGLLLGLTSVVAGHVRAVLRRVKGWGHSLTIAVVALLVFGLELLPQSLHPLCLYDSTVDKFVNQMQNVWWVVQPRGYEAWWMSGTSGAKPLRLSQRGIDRARPASPIRAMRPAAISPSKEL